MLFWLPGEIDRQARWLATGIGAGKSKYKQLECIICNACFGPVPCGLLPPPPARHTCPPGSQLHHSCPQEF